MPTDPYRFGRYVLQPGRRELLVDGGPPLRLGARAFDILLALAEAGGGVVSREALLERAWPGRAVLDDNLKVQVLALRRLLGSDAVVTVPGHGYRLGWPVTRGPAPTKAASEGTPASPSEGEVATAGEAVPPAGPGALAVNEGGRPPADATVVGAGPSAGAAGAAERAHASRLGQMSLVGRAAELDDLRKQLVPGALVTVAGPGGIGKTRLALAAAKAAATPAATSGAPGTFGPWPDGHAVVELAPLNDPGTLPATVARALALPPVADEAALAAALRPLALLLVLDNAEHLREPVAGLVQALREGAPRLTLLVTSQEPLGLHDEQVMRLGGLAAPAGDAVDEVRASPAAALFESRAAAASAAVSPSSAGAGFAIDAHNAAAVAEICRRLDGTPLALELAAARVPLLGAAGVLERLREPLALLTRGTRGERAQEPPRHQTLRAALQWSHGLLEPAEKALWRRLSVFAGSFTLAAAQQVAGDDEGLDEWAVIDHLEALVAKSLVQVLADGDQRRFRLLETARLFAQECLHEAGEAPATRRRHAEAMRRQFEAADERYAAEPMLPWLQALRPELDNLRAAMQWALGPEGDEDLALALAGAAGGFWALAGMNAEVGPLLRRLSPRAEDERVPLAVRTRFWLAVANRGGDTRFGWRETYEAAERAVALARQGGLAGLLHRALGHRLPLAQRVGADVDGAATAAEMRALEGPEWNTLQRRARRAAEAFALFQRGDWERFGAAERAELVQLREAGDLYRAWFVAHRVALADTATGRAAEAVSLMQQAVDEIRAHGFMRQCWQQVAMLAMARIETGHAPAAPVHEAVRLMRSAGALAWMGCHLAEWLAQRGRLADAARLLAWVARRHAERGEAPSGHGERSRARTLAALQAAAEPALADTWRAEGEAWDDDDVAAALLAVGDEGDAGRDDGDAARPLSPRRPAP